MTTANSRETIMNCPRPPAPRKETIRSAATSCGFFSRWMATQSRNISFVGSGCCISKASASLLTEFAKGKTKADVEIMFGQVHEMVTSGNVQGDVGKLAVFAGVHKFPARVKCAILSWHAVMAALKGDQKPVTTESEAT